MKGLRVHTPLFPEMSGIIYRMAQKSCPIANLINTRQIITNGNEIAISINPLKPNGNYMYQPL
jgi:hypothetical protein